ELKEWVVRTLGRVVSRHGLRRVLREAGLTWKEIKKLLGKADPEKRAAPIPQLLPLFTGARDGEVILISGDEVPVHRDLDHGYTWGRIGPRIWRRSDCPQLSDRMNAYGAYDFTYGECFLWQNGWCNGEEPVNFLRALVAWRAGQEGRLVLIWDNAP